MSGGDDDPGRGIHPLDPRAAHRATRIVDPLLFCPGCGSDDQVESADADTVTFTDTGETVRAAVCLRCRKMWTETSPSGKAIQADTGGGAKGTTISIPGAPVRPYSDPKLDPRLVTLNHPQDARIRERRIELRRDIASYERCTVRGHGSCRCGDIERKWSRLWDS